VTFTVHAEEDYIPVRGNAMASDDPEFDKKVEDEIIARLEAGDVWAWASVTVRAKWNGFVGEDHLGGCCYWDEEDFKKSGGYYEDMKAEALTALNRELRSLDAVLSQLR